MNEQQLSTSVIAATEASVAIGGGISAGLSIAMIVALVKAGQGKTLMYGALIGGASGLALYAVLPKANR